MNFKHIVFGFVCSSLLLATAAAGAGEQAAAEQASPRPASLLERYTANAQELAIHALSQIGIRYRHGGESPDTGFDCSGLVRHVFREALGLGLPRTARAISQTGESIRADELQPGDLVFFNTLRRGFSHVGIYLGEHRFVHAPSSGGKVRIESMRQSYWAKRFNGARRILAAGTEVAQN